MKTFALLLSLCALACASVVSADSVNDSSIKEDYVNLLRVDLRATKAEIVTNTLELTTAEMEKFWPLYQDYDLELVKLNTERIAVLREFAALYASIDDARAETMTHRTFEFQKRRLALLEKYYGKVAKALTPATAARFVQLEHQLLMLVDVQIASELPLIPRKAMIVKSKK